MTVVVLVEKPLSFVIICGFPVFMAFCLQVYSPKEKVKLFRLSTKTIGKSSRFAWAILTIAVVYVWIFSPGRFNFSSYCDICGAEQWTTEWQWKQNSKLFDSNKVESTRFSRLVTQRKLVPDHEHHWQFNQGGGNGIKCALGLGHTLNNTINSEHVCDFLIYLSTHSDAHTTQKWINRFLDVRHAREWVSDIVIVELSEGQPAFQDSLHRAEIMASEAFADELKNQSTQ